MRLLTLRPHDPQRARLRLAHLAAPDQAANPLSHPGPALRGPALRTQEEVAVRLWPTDEDRELQAAALTLMALIVGNALAFWLWGLNG